MRTWITLALSCFAFLSSPGFASPSSRSSSENWIEGFEKTGVSLRDEGNNPVLASAWNGKRLAVTMSYTSCKKTCPMVTMKKLEELEKNFGSDLQLIVITFDPENDTPAELVRYKKDNGFERPNWHFLTGTTKDVRRISEYLGMNDYWRMDDHILHGFKILLVDSDGKLRHVMDWNHRSVPKTWPN